MKDIVFLIRREDDYMLGGNFDFSVDKYFEIMSPHSMDSRGLSLDPSQWNIEVGGIKINYTWSIRGIQMRFSDFTNEREAQNIAQEIMQNLEKHTGHRAILENTAPHHSAPQARGRW